MITFTQTIIYTMITRNYLLAAFCFFISLTAFSQNPKKQMITFKYNQLPKMVIAEDGKYSREVIVTYAEEVRAEKAALEEINKELRDEAKKDKEDWKESDMGDKITKKLLLGEKKPSGRANLEEVPYYPTLFDAIGLEGQYAKIPGLEVDQDVTAKVMVFVERFTYEYSQVKATETKGPGYYVNGTVPIRVEIYDSAGNQVAAESFEAGKAKGKNNHTSKSFESVRQRDTNWRTNRNGVLSKIERNQLNAGMKLMETYLKNMCGYNVISRKAPLFSIAEKKHSYTEINMLLPDLIEAFNLLQVEYETAKPILEKAVSIWEKELEGLEVGNKKARITEKVGEALYVNVVEAKIWLNDYMGAMKSIAKYKVMDPKGKSKEIKNLEKLLEDEQMRYEANHP